MKTTIPNWTGHSAITFELLEASDKKHLATISLYADGLSFCHAMNEEGLNKLISDAIHMRNLMRVQPKIIPGEALESGELIPADQLNKGKS